MRPTGRYRCTGCDVVFSNAQAWRDGSGQGQMPPPQQVLEDQRAPSVAR